MRAAIFAMILAGSAAPAADEPPVAPAPRLKDDGPLDQLKGTWVETSVQYFGQELFDPPGTSNLMTFNGTTFTELMPSGKLLANGEIAVAGPKGGVFQVDLPKAILIRTGPNRFAIKTITVAAIGRFVGQNQLQLCYYDPDLILPGQKRPEKFESTTTNGAVLITLKRK